MVATKTASGDFCSSGRISVTSDRGAEHEAEGHADERGEGERHAGVVGDPRDVCRQRGHLALGEVEVAGAAVDDDEAEGDEGVDRPGRQAEEQGVEEAVHQYPR